MSSLQTSGHLRRGTHRRIYPTEPPKQKQGDMEKDWRGVSETKAAAREDPPTLKKDHEKKRRKNQKGAGRKAL